jgi:hypothetical protein
VLAVFATVIGCVAIGCVDEANTISSNPPYPASYLRGALGCDHSAGEVVGLTQRLLGCPDHVSVQPPMVAAPGAPMDNPAAVSGDDRGTAAMPPSMTAGGPDMAMSSPSAPPVGGASGAGSTVVAAGVACGAQTCAMPATGQPCCLDATNGTCGVLSGTMCSAAGTPASPEPCPVADLTRVGYGKLAACCTADRQCGVNTQQFPGGMACTSLVDAKRTAENMGYKDLVPPARACP